MTPSAPLLLIGALLVVSTRGYYDGDRFDRALQTLQTLPNVKRLSDTRSEERRVPMPTNCHNEDQTCGPASGFHKCCGTLQCYYKDGISFTKEGECVKCIKEKQACQIDTQCCEGLQCARKDFFRVDGICKFLKGADEQCILDRECLSGRCKWSFANGLTFKCTAPATTPAPPAPEPAKPAPGPAIPAPAPANPAPAPVPEPANPAPTPVPVTPAPAPVTPAPARPPTPLPTQEKPAESPMIEPVEVPGKSESLEPSPIDEGGDDGLLPSPLDEDDYEYHAPGSSEKNGKPSKPENVA